MKKRITLLIVFFLTCWAVSFAQNRTVKGVIKDKQGIPLPGVSVQIKGSKTATSSGSDGTYGISVPDNSRLIYTAVGFTAQEIAVDGRTQLNVTLVEEAQDLTEVVVIGYGTAQKKDVTGAVSSVKAAQLENENPNSVTDILRGNIPGLS